MVHLTTNFKAEARTEQTGSERVVDDSICSFAQFLRHSATVRASPVLNQQEEAEQGPVEQLDAPLDKGNFDFRDENKKFTFSTQHEDGSEMGGSAFRTSPRAQREGRRRISDSEERIEQMEQSVLERWPFLAEHDSLREYLA